MNVWFFFALRAERGSQCSVVSISMHIRNSDVPQKREIRLARQIKCSLEQMGVETLFGHAAEGRMKNSSG